MNNKSFNQANNYNIAELKKDVTNIRTIDQFVFLFPRIKQIFFAPMFTSSMFQCAKLLLLKMLDLSEQPIYPTLNNSVNNNRLLMMLQISMNDDCLKRLKSAKKTDINVHWIQEKMRILENLINSSMRPAHPTDAQPEDSQPETVINVVKEKSVEDDSIRQNTVEVFILPESNQRT